MVAAAFLLSLVLSFVLPSTIARSHSGIARSEPASGAVLRRPPAVVEAWFDDRLSDNGRNALRVFAPDGSRLDEGGPTVDPDDSRHLWTAIVDGTAAGSYRVEWRASAEDGHPSEGAFTFAVNPSDPSAWDPLASSGGERGVSPARWLLGGAALGAVAIGGAWVGVRARRRGRA